MSTPIHRKHARASRAGLYRGAEHEPMALTAIPHPAIGRAIAAGTVLAPRRTREQGRHRVPVLTFLVCRALALMGTRSLPARPNGGGRAGEGSPA